MEFFNVGNRLREIRLSEGFTQEQIAHIADITPAYLGRVERGEMNVTVFTLEKICNALNITLADFFSPARNYNADIDEISMQIINMLMA